MKAFKEECLRLSARALEGNITGQDVNEASLWFGMVGEHFQETNVDSAIRTYASKALGQIQTTGVPIDSSGLETEISQQLSARVGWDVEGRIHPIFAASLDEDTRRLSYLTEHGLSESLLGLSKALVQASYTIPTDMRTHVQQPHLLDTKGSVAHFQESIYLRANIERVAATVPILPPSVCQTITQGSETTGGAAITIAFICIDSGPLAAFAFPELCGAGAALGLASGLLLLLHGFACH